MKAKHIGEYKVCIQSGNVLTSPWIQGCYSCLLETTNIRFTMENSNYTNLGYYKNHCFDLRLNCIKCYYKNHCFNLGPSCIKLCVEQEIQLSVS
jgi:hypothetical protein